MRMFNFTKKIAEKLAQANRPRGHRTLLSTVLGVTFAMSMASLPVQSHAAPTDEFFKLISLDDYRAIPKLLDAGLNPNVKGGERGNTGLILAVQENSMKSFNVLLDAKGVDLNAQATNGDTALMVASYKNNVEAVNALLAKGAAVNKAGWTPLHYAAAAGNGEIVQILLKAGAQVNALSPNKTTPLMMAARSGKTDTMDLLEKAGANANLKNDVGMTAMDFYKKFKAPPSKADGMQGN